MRVIIAGSRTIIEPKLISEAVANSGFNVTEVVEGGARGVDTLAFDWAHQNSIPVRIIVADWHKHGRAAGPIRNAEMADYGDALIAIWDGKSKGTADMMRQMERRHKPFHLTICRASVPILNIDHLGWFQRSDDSKPKEQQGRRPK